MEQAITYTANAGSDTVVLYSMPIEVFGYEVYKPDGKGGYNPIKIRRNIPHPAAVRTMDLEKYQEIQKDFKGVLPDISSDVFTHSLGDPATYPSSLPREGGSIGKVIAYSGEPVGFGFSASGSAITQEISMSKEDSNHFELVHALDFKIGAGAGGFTAGTTFGVSAGGGKTTVTTSGSSFSGTLQAMPIEAEGYGYGHLWKIFSYQYNKDKISFPVVNYMVTNVNRPAPLPTDFAQDVEKSTDKTAVLTWNYDRPVAGFQLYSHNKYPDGAGVDELAYVPFTQGRQEDGRYFFEYQVENLSPYTDYQFKIQTIQSGVPQKSIPSQTLSVKTKTQNGYPNIKIRNLTEKTDIEEGKIALYPDADLEIQAYIDGSNENYKGLNYQWQKKDAAGQWRDLSGKTESSLRFKKAGYADRGVYRCRINLRYFDPTAQKEFYISSYSGELTASYQKRPVDLGGRGLFASAFNTGGMKGVNASAELVSASAGHYTAPTGQVRFLLTGVDYRQEKLVKLNTTGNPPQNSKNVAKAETSFEHLKDGVYQLSVSYLGDGIFASREISEQKTAVVGNTAGKIAYLSDGKDRKERFLYGDRITASVSEVSESSERASTENYNYRLYKYKDHAFWQQKSKKDEHRDSAGSLSQAPSWNFAPEQQTAGYYLLHVENADASWSNDIFFSIERRKIRLKAEDKKASQGNVDSVPPSFAIEPENALVAGDDLTADIQYEFYDSSGKKVEPFGNTTDPGNYRVKIGVKESSAYHQKYEFSLTNGLYTIVGRAFQVNLEAKKIDGLIAGSVKADEFSGNSGQISAGTRLHLTASPNPGYAVDRWEVYEEGNDSKPINTQTGGSLFTHTLTSSETKIVVTFKKVGHSVTLYQPKSGGRIKNVNGTEFPDGVSISVAKGSRFDFRAEPAEGYNFKRWNISPNTTDVILETKGDTVKIAAAKTNIQIRAEFERDKYRLRLGEHIGAYHMHDHDNDTSTEKIKREILSGESVSKDEEVFCYLTPGYQKAEGARWKIDGKDQDDSLIVGDELKIAANSVSGKEITVTLASTKKSLEIRAKTAKIEAGEVREAADRGNISVKVNDVLVSDAEALKNIAGSSKVVFEAKAAHGFKFSHWRVGGKIIPGSDPIYTIPQLAETTEVFAVIEEEEAHSVTVTIHPPEKAEPKYILTDRYGETLVEKSFASGEAIPVFKGDSLKIALKLDPYTIVDQWQIEDLPLTHNDPEHSLTDI
ncbi:MAG: hypothetical protein Q4A78_12565 [Peptostreptococcaceae bacterium]|nr:hypothetical protein [Peptostreptococcaceae bacterium]